MSLPLALALIFSQDPDQDMAPAMPAPQANYTVAQVIAEPNRIALTPMLDGKLELEEWDEFSSAEGASTFFQWEPGKLHVASSGPAGVTLVLSLDFKGDGWLVGKDNVEVRISEGRAVARLLDATNVAGPTWIDLPSMSMAAVVASGTHEGQTFTEASLGDGGLGLFQTGSRGKVSVRIDLDSSQEAPGALTPRLLSAVELVTERAAAYPTGIKWGVEASGRTVLPGDATKMRFTFEGSTMQPTKLEMRSEGLARDTTYETTVPFPAFDRRGRAFVDYSTQVTPNASTGYRILRGTLQTADGVPGIVQMSYRIAPLLDIELVRETINVSDRDQTKRLAYYVTSNSTRRINGEMTVKLPRELRGINGEEKKFVIYNSRGRIRNVVEVQIPAGTRGVFPIVFTADVGGKVIEHTGYLHVSG